MKLVSELNDYDKILNKVYKLDNRYRAHKFFRLLYVPLIIMIAITKIFKETDTGDVIMGGAVLLYFLAIIINIIKLIKLSIARRHNTELRLLYLTKYLYGLKEEVQTITINREHEMIIKTTDGETRIDVNDLTDLDDGVNRLEHNNIPLMENIKRELCSEEI